MPNPIKLKRYEAIIAETINKTIVFDVRNPDVKLGRVTYVDLTKDLSIATAYVECANHNDFDKLLKALNSISGLFRSKVCEALDIYKTPKIVFKLDKTIQYAENIDKIIKDIKSKQGENSGN